MNRLQGQMDLIDFINSKPRHEPIEPKYADVTAWRHYYERLHIYKSSLSWLFANEYYRMTLEDKYKEAL